MPSSWSFKNVKCFGITDTTQQYHPNILHQIQPQNGKIEIYLPNAVSAPSCFNTPRFQVRRLGHLVLEYAGRSQGWPTLPNLIKENTMCLGARYKIVSPQKPYLNHDALRDMLVKNDPTYRNTPQNITPSMPVFDAMINVLRSNNLVQFIEQITTKIKSDLGENSFISLGNRVIQTQGMQCCIIENQFGVQVIGVTPLDNQQKYKLPHLDFVLGLSCLTENKMPAPLHRYPQTTQKVKAICKHISNHTFLIAGEQLRVPFWPNQPQ